MNRDLTVGKPGRVLWQYVLPLFASIVFQQMYNIADSFIAGFFLGTEALAAVGNSYEITLLYIAVAFGCNVGTSVVTARYFGLHNYRELKTTVYTALVSSSVIALALTAIGIFATAPLLRLIQTDAVIFADSREYLLIYICGFLFLMIYNICTGIFSALGDSRTPFLFLAVSSVANVGVNILFVTVFDMGVAGLAWATFLCQGLSGVLALLAVLRRLRPLRAEDRPRVFCGARLLEIGVVALPSMIQQGFISVGNVVIQGFINGFGPAATGGYAAAIKLNNMTITSVTALGNGMSNFTAQNIGAGKVDRIRAGFRSGELLALVIAVAFTLLYYLAGPALLELFIRDGNVKALDIGISFLHIVAPFYCVVAFKLIADGLLRGLARMRLFMAATLTDLTLRVLLSFIFSRTHLGITGIWLSWPIGWGVALVMSLLFLRYVLRRDLVKDNR